MADRKQPASRRDLRLRDFATTPDDAPIASDGPEADLLPNRAYPSNLFWRMAQALTNPSPPGRVLDLGPTHNANIQFWVGRGFDVTCHDLFAHETRRLATVDCTPLTLSTDALRQQRLPFDDGSFSAICSWNVLSRLPFVLAQQYARECHRVLAPGGILHAIFLDAPGRLDTRRQYHVADRQRLQVTSTAVPPRVPDTLVESEIRLMLSRFAACEIQPAPSHTREALAQRASARSP